jgi:hypothetical protein
MSGISEPTQGWRRDLVDMSSGPAEPEDDDELEGEFEDEDWEDEDDDEFDEDDLEEDEIEDWEDEDEVDED